MSTTPPKAVSDIEALLGRSVLAVNGRAQCGVSPMVRPHTSSESGACVTVVSHSPRRDWRRTRATVRLVVRIMTAELRGCATVWKLPFVGGETSALITGQQD